MISIAIILGIAAAFIATLIIFWKNIVEWIKKAVKKLQEVLGIVVKGTKTFIKRTADGMQNISKYYNVNKLTGEWEENIYTKAVSESEVPEDILKKVQKYGLDEEVSTTEELQLALTK